MAAPPSPAPSTTAPQKKGFRTRVGTLVRRTSSSLSIGSERRASKASTSSKDSDEGSLKHLDTALAPPAHEVSGPSPIAESPAREQAALEPPQTEHAPKGPSPLAAAVLTNESPTSELPPSELPDAQQPPAPAAEPGLQAPQIKETPATPSVTGEPSDQAAPAQPEVANGDVAVEAKPAVEKEPIPETARAAESDEGIQTEAPPNLSVAEGATSYFDIPAPQTITPSHPVDDVSEPIAEPAVAPPAPAAPLRATEKAPGEDNPWANRTGYVSTKTSAASLAAIAAAHPDRYVPPQPSHSNGDVSYATTIASSHRPSEDPFRDPFADPPAPPGLDQRYSEQTVRMPEPHASVQVQPEPSIGPTEMPQPQVVEPTASKSIHDMPSEYSASGADAPTRSEPVTDERQPLLPRPGSPRDQRTSYLQPSASSRLNSSIRTGDGSYPVSTPLLHNLGWIEYVLPDGSFYYVHPTLRTTTDIDLRSPKKLEAVTAYFDRKNGGVPVPPLGYELWLRDASTKPKDLKPVRNWVDHRKRMVSFDPPSTAHPGRTAGDDKMDMEYRYWSFMESHPAHVALPANARAEALDVLTWSWTDRLLPSDRPISPPFSQEECGELMGLLRSFSDSPSDSSINTVVHTRAVARILMRIGQWRQAYFRPQKPLPRDAVKDGLRYSGRRIPFSRAAFDFVVSVVCLGIPYIFMNRSHFHRVDEEGGLQSAGPMLVVGACACLIAAIVLSASVTFISLPGLDSVARVAGFVAILTSTASMVSALIVLFRYKADAQQSARSFVGEGMVLISRRSVVLSLPLVFLAYAIIAFVAGVIIYSFNGVTVTNVGTITRHFDQHTRWFVMGTIGGLAGVLITAALLSRR